MLNIRTKTKQSVVALLGDLNLQDLKETADFILFLKTRALIDPAQAYFWTERWQSMERKIERHKKRKQIIGDGSVASLLNNLRT